jgi:hypothetical protein
MIKTYSVYDQRDAYCGEISIDTETLASGEIEISDLDNAMILADVPENDISFYHIEGSLDEDYMEIWGYDGHCYMTMILEEE